MTAPRADLSWLIADVLAALDVILSTAPSDIEADLLVVQQRLLTALFATFHHYH